MRFPGEDTVVLTRGMAERKSLSIEANAKAFRTLIDTLYTDKIESPVREWMSNALDSHIAAGKEDIPFEVRLPSKFKSVFSVKDYGVGMTHEFMMDYFTVLYYSTKDGTQNELVADIDPDKLTGTLGLGRMSFFGYTDSATITCTDGVEKRIYSVHMASGRLPDMAVMHRGPCSEPTSVTMELSVREGDHDAFMTAFKHVMLAYDTIPNIMPQAAMNSFHGGVEGWKATVMKTGRITKIPFPVAYGFGYGVRIKQGTVTYPASVKLQADKRYKNCMELLSLGGLKNNLYVIDFPLGSLGFQPSREHLEDTDENIARIVNELEKMTAEVRQDLIDSVNSLPTIQHKLYFCKEKFTSFDSTLHLLGLTDVQNYADRVGKFEIDIKDNQSISRRSHSRTQVSTFKNSIGIGKTAAFKMVYNEVTFSASRWWNVQTILINDKYEKYGSSVKDHASEFARHLSNEFLQTDYEEGSEKEVFIDRDDVSGVLDYYKRQTTSPLVFFHTTKKALQEIFPAAKIYYLSEYERKREKIKHYRGEDLNGKPVEAIDATDKMVFIRRRVGKEVEYYLPEFGREIPISDWRVMKNSLSACNIEGVVVYARFLKEVKYLHRRITLDNYLDARLINVPKSDAEEHARQMNNASLSNLEGVVMKRVYNMNRYIPKPLMDKIISQSYYSKSQWLKFIAQRDNDRSNYIQWSILVELAKQFTHPEFTIDPYVQLRLDQVCHQYGIKLCPPGHQKEYLRPSELIYLRFLCTVYDVMQITSNLSKTGFNSQTQIQEKKLPEMKYLKSVFGKLDDYILELRSKLERKYDAEL